MSKWRWDQGRLIYFDYNNLKLMAQSLIQIDGASLRDDPDPLRGILEQNTGMPFAPSSYRVWRNYKRVFECSFLATSIENKINCTDFCKELALQSGKFQDVDDYLFHYIPRFRFPYPAFQDYNSKDKIIYPYCAVLKLLFSRLIFSNNPILNLEDVFTYLIGNNVDGTEELSYYRDLQPKSYTPKGDEKRQVREMLIFISQMSILKWHKKSMILDISVADFHNYNDFSELLTPHFIQPKVLKAEDFFSLTNLNEANAIIKLQPRESPNDEVFIEGKRSRVTHLKIERSPILRKMFLEAFPEPICDMCICNTKNRYPWTKYLIEIHHVLPLSSSLGITSKGTSLNDVVGLCPTCHRSVHLYYNKWLKLQQVDDFNDRDEALEVYHEAKAQIVA